jgi:DNA invertase Pin-like site-specific DNA recombinase
MSKKVAIYARVSTDRQTTDSQLHELREFVRRAKWTVYREYIDTGYSGKNIQRPAFTEMLTDARHRQFDLLIVWKLDRLSRSLRDLITTLDELGHLGIDFISYDNQLDTSSPSGKLVFNIIGAVAEFERDIICERVRAGLANARQKGKKLGRPRIPKSDLKKIISLKNQGLSNRAIGRRLSIAESTVRNWLKAESIVDLAFDRKSTLK